MENTKATPSPAQQYIIIAFSVVILCFLLFSLDWETHHVSDLFTPGNLVALLVYFTPTFIISLLLFHAFAKKHTYTKSTVMSLVIGVPLSFTLVICSFLLLRH